jgi:uncharacterized phage protein (TIGR01671 family)
MRTIKFRAWDINNKVMIHDGIILDMSDCSRHSVMASFAYENPETIILMQFTGLLDKNGKEIYEGDILVTSNDDPEYDLWDAEMYGPTIAEWDAVGLGWTGASWCWDDSDESVFAKKFIEVIGNVYENPELMV